MTDDVEPADAVNLCDLLAAIDSHPGKKARQSWDALRLVHTAFAGNQAELFELVAAIESNHDDVGIAMASNAPQYADRSQALYAELSVAFTTISPAL